MDVRFRDSPIEERFLDFVSWRFAQRQKRGDIPLGITAQNAGRKASGLPGKRRRERLSYIFVGDARADGGITPSMFAGHDVSCPYEGKGKGGGSR